MFRTLFLFLFLNSCVLDRPGFMKHFLFIHPYACIHLLMVVSSYVFIVFHFCCAGCIQKSGTRQISWFIISIPLKIATWGLEQSDFQTFRQKSDQTGCRSAQISLYRKIPQLFPNEDPGIFVGFLCAQYTVKSVLLVFALTFVLIAAWI